MNNSNSSPFELLKKNLCFCWMCFLYTKVNPFVVWKSSNLYSAGPKVVNFKHSKTQCLNFPIFSFSTTTAVRLAPIFNSDKRTDLNIPSQYWLVTKILWIDIYANTCVSFVKSRTTDAQWSLFPSKSQTFGLGQTIWADKFGAFGVFSAKVSAPILVQWVPCPFYKKLSLYIHIPNIYLGFGFEFGLQRIRDLAFVSP